MVGAALSGVLQREQHMIGMGAQIAHQALRMRGGQVLRNLKASHEIEPASEFKSLIQIRGPKCFGRYQQRARST